MVLAAHIAIAGLLGSQTRNYFLAALVGFLSHYALDGVPHWDEYISPKLKQDSLSGRQLIKTLIFWREMFKVALDIFFGFLLLAALFKFSNPGYAVSALIGALFGIFPDPLQMLYWLTKWHALKWNFDIQEFLNHKIWEKMKITPLPGIAIQAAAILMVYAAINIL